MWWAVWYGGLALLLLPFVALAVAFARARPGETSAALDKAFAFTSVAWFGLAGAAVVAAILWTRAAQGAGVWIYLRNGAMVAVVAVVLGLLVGFPATMYVASHTYPMRSRGQALALSLLVAAAYFTFCVLAALRLT
jgi:hypothetical protein